MPFFVPIRLKLKRMVSKFNLAVLLFVFLANANLFAIADCEMPRGLQADSLHAAKDSAYMDSLLQALAKDSTGFVSTRPGKVDRAFKNLWKKCHGFELQLAKKGHRINYLDYRYNMFLKSRRIVEYGVYHNVKVLLFDQGYSSVIRRFAFIANEKHNCMHITVLYLDNLQADSVSQLCNVRYRITESAEFPNH